MESLKKQCQMIGTMDGYEINNRVYGIGGVCPCISARDYKDAKKILEEQRDEQNNCDRSDGQHGGSYARTAEQSI